jgi:hypothetical protein
MSPSTTQKPNKLVGAVTGSLAKTEVRLELGYCVLPRSADGARSHSVPYQKTSSVWDRLSASKFPFRHPVLHGSLLDFRSFLYRIRLLWKRGGTRSLRIGWVYQQRGAQQGLALNRETQARSMGMQQLLFDCPWLSSEDCHLWLIGWNAGREWRESLGTAENNDDRRDS